MINTLTLHLDVDAFFASVEQLLIPALRGRPVAVGNGCIASCSYEARRFGLHAGVSLVDAKKRCPELVILDGQYPIYRCFAEQIWEICRRYTMSLETFLDEAYGQVDVEGLRLSLEEPQTGIAQHRPTPQMLGLRLQRQVREETGLDVSVGLGANRMLAKLASKAAKPAGVRWISPGQAADVVAALPIRSIPGIGSKTAHILADLNIATGGDLRRLSREDLVAMFGVRGEVLYERCRGNDIEIAGPGQGGLGTPRKLPRTISRETTFHSPQSDPKQIRGMLFYLLERAMRTVRQAHLVARTVELVIRYDDWKQYEARQSLEETELDGEVFAVVESLLTRLHTRRVSLRHVGVVLLNFRRAEATPSLFEPAGRQRRRDLHRAVDAIRDRWGHGAIVAGESASLLGRLKQNDYGFVLRTPSLTK
jgi:DNA polymerase IV